MIIDRDSKANLVDKARLAALRRSLRGAAAILQRQPEVEHEGGSGGAVSISAADLRRLAAAAEEVAESKAGGGAGASAGSGASPHKGRSPERTGASADASADGEHASEPGPGRPRSDTQLSYDLATARASALEARLRQQRESSAQEALRAAQAVHAASRRMGELEEELRKQRGIALNEAERAASLEGQLRREKDAFDAELRRHAQRGAELEAQLRRATAPGGAKRRLEDDGAARAESPGADRARRRLSPRKIEDPQGFGPDSASLAADGAVTTLSAEALAAPVTEAV